MNIHFPKLATGLVFASALTLAACSGGSSSQGGDSADPGPETGTINLLAADDESAYAPVITAFEAANPGITVDFSQVPFDQFNATLQQRLDAKDETIDVYTVDQPRVAQLAAKGFLVDLSDLDAQLKDATTPAQYDANHYQDTLYSLPMWNSTQFLFYNKTVLQEAGITPPPADPSQRWTWEQVSEAGRTAMDKTGISHGLFFEQPEGYYQLQPLIESAGGGSGITGDDMLTADITSEGWVKALTWYRETFESGLSPRGIGGFQTGAVFSDGNVAFFVGGPWDLGIFAQSTVDWGVAPMPYFEGGEEYTPTGSWGLGINPASTKQAMARKFIEFATLNAAGNKATTDALTIIPANVEAEAQYLPGLETIAGEKSAGAAAIVAYESANTALPRPVSVGYIQFEEVLTKAFADIRNGADAKTRLDQASQQLTDAWKAIR